MLINKHYQFLPIVVYLIIHVVVLTSNSPTTVLYDSLRSLLISQTALTWYMNDGLLFLMCLYPLYKSYAVGRWFFIIATFYCLSNALLIAMMWLIAILMEVDFPQSTFSILTVVGLAAFSALAYQWGLRKRELAIAASTLLIATTISAYLMTFQTKYFIGS